MVLPMYTHESGHNILSVQPALGVDKFKGEAGDFVVEVFDYGALLHLSFSFIEIVGYSFKSCESHLQVDFVRMCSVGEPKQVLWREEEEEKEEEQEEDKEEEEEEEEGSEQSMKD